MTGLIYKDIRSNRSFLGGLIGTSAFGLLLLILASSDDDFSAIESFFRIVAVGMMFMGFDLYNSSIMASEESRLAKQYYASLPLGAKGCIQAKFIHLIASSAIMLALLEIINYIALWRDNGAADLSLVNILVFDFMIVQTSFGAPFLARYGAKAGSSYRTAFMMLLMSLVLIYLMFGDLSIFGSMDSFVEKMITLSDKIKNHKNSIGKIVIIATPLSLLITYLAYILTYKYYYSGLDKDE